MRKKIFTLLFAIGASVGMMHAAIVNGTCGDNLTWSLNTRDSTLTISGTGEMTSHPWDEYKEYVAHVVLPEGLTNICTHAFSSSSCTSLTSITIPNSVTTIESNAFWNNGTLTSIVFGSGVTHVGMGTFYCCNSLSAVYITDLAKWCAIEYEAADHGDQIYQRSQYPLTYAHNLYLNGTLVTDLIIPQGVTSINTGIFYGCHSIRTVVVPNSVTSIGWSAFCECINLESIYLPNSVTSIGGYAFKSCEKLKHITIPNNVTSIERSTFQWCDRLDSVIIPSSVTSIGAYAFYDSDGLKSITISEGVISLSSYAFTWCDNLTTVTIPNSVISIEDGVFMGCSKLTSITLGSSLSQIGQSAFSSGKSGVNGNVKRVTCYAMTPPNGGRNSGINNTSCTLFVPAEYVDTYANSIWWEDFAHIYPIGGAFTVQFVDWNGKILSEQIIAKDSSAIAPTAPTRQGYTFTGWDAAFDSITTDLVVNALYERNIFTVTFVDWNGETISTQKVNKGDSAITPSNPYRYDYVFIGWDKDFSHVTEDIVVTALYRSKLHNYTIRLYAPDACEWMIPGIYVSNANTSYNPAMQMETDEENRTVYTCTLEGIRENLRISFFEYEQDAIDSENRLITYSNGIWHICSDTLPVSFQVDTTIILDHSNNELYRYLDCTPYTSHNLNIVHNNDDTYTISWTAPAAEDVTRYEVYVYGPEGQINAYTNVNKADTSVTLSIPLSMSGEYQYTVYAFGPNNYAQATSTFNVEPVAEHTITARVLIQSNSGIDTSNGVQFAIRKPYENGQHWDAVDAISDGNNWYSYTHTTTHPGIFFNVLGNGSYNNIIVSHDTCLECSTTLHYVSCDAHVVDYTPYNLQAVPGEGEVTLSWEVQDTAQGYRVVTYNEGQQYTSDWIEALNATITLYNKEEETLTWSVQPYDQNGPLGDAVYGEAFTVAPSPYTPQNLNATPNGDGTFTITWSPIAIEGIFHYTVDVFSADTWQDICYGYANTDSSYVTTVIPYAGEYLYQIDVYDANWNNVGIVQNRLYVDPVPEHTITARILVQPSSGLDTSNEVAIYRFEPTGIQSYAAVNEGAGWYSYTWTTTDPGVSIDLQQTYWDRFMSINRDTCLEYTSDLHYVSCEAHLTDYTPYNLHAEPGAGKVTLSWDVLDRADRYRVALYANGQETHSKWCYDTIVTFTFSNSTDTTMTWSVHPVANGDWVGEPIYGEAFTVTPSPYVPQNLRATDNGDGTFTITWSPVEGEDFAFYYVDIHDEYYYSVSIQVPVDNDTTFNTGVLPAGTITYAILTFDEDWNVLGYSFSTIEVDPVPAHDITVRVLINYDSDVDTADGVSFLIDNFAERKWDTIPAVSEGSRWYHYTFTITDRYFRFKLPNTNTISIFNDTCLQLSRYLQSATCDAEPSDYRIIPESMTAVSTPGRTYFSWSAVTKSDCYMLELINAETNRTIARGYVYDTSHLYIVPNNYDSLIVKWKVTPLEPVNLSSVEAPETVMLLKSEIELTNLTTTTTDSIIFTFSWDSNTENVLYRIGVAYNFGGYWQTIKLDTISETSYQFVLPYNGTYYWAVQALDPEDEKPLSAWFYGVDFETQSIIENPTAIFNTEATPAEETRKLLRNGQILILRGDKVYTITGQEIR